MICEEYGRKSRTRLRWKLLAATVSPLIVLGSIEAGVRIAGIDPVSRLPLMVLKVENSGTSPVTWDDELLWRLKPDAPAPGGSDRVNAQGYRGRPFSVEKKKGAARVLCLGDSCTFGLTVPEDATFARRLERWLASDARQEWDVLNTGVPGYSLWQMTEFFRLRGAAMEPDVVLAYPAAWNDYTPGIAGPDSAVAEQLRKSREGLGRLRLVQLLRSWLQRGRDQRAAEAKKAAPTESSPERARVPPAEFARLIVDLRDQVRARGARLVMLVPPSPEATRKERPEGEPYPDIIRRVGAENGIPVVDLRKLFDETRRTDLFTDKIHPSEEGHRIIFDAVAAELAATQAKPPMPVKPEKSDPIDLNDLKGAFRIGEGSTFRPPEGSEVTQADATITSACPCQLGFQNVRVPPQAALVVKVAIGKPRKDHPEGTTLRVYCAPTGSEPKEIFGRTYPADSAPGQEDSFRADLSAFAGKAVTLVLEVTGTASDVTWSSGAICAYR